MTKKNLKRPVPKLFFLFFSALLLFPVSCKKVVVTQNRNELGKNAGEQSLIAAQGISVSQEMESIEAFLARSGWEMQSTGTGLRYEIYQEARPGTPQVELGDAVKVSYSLQLLNGAIVEEVPPEAPRTFILGKSPMVPGLEQALLLLKKGERARILLPSHLAYGFSGDGNRIPPRATLLYDLCVEDIRIPPRPSSRDRNQPQSQDASR